MVLCAPMLDGFLLNSFPKKYFCVQKKRRRWDVQTRNAPGTEEPAKKKSGESSKPVLSAEAMVAEAKKRAAAMLHAKSVKPKTFDPVAAAKARAAAINKTFIQRQQEKCQTQSPGVPKNQVNQQQMMPLGSSVAVSGAQTQTQQSPPAIPQTPGTAVVTTPLNQVALLAHLLSRYASSTEFFCAPLPHSLLLFQNQGNVLCLVRS